MTPEEQVIAIAELCGWGRSREFIYEEDEFGRWGYRRDIDGNSCYWWRYYRPDGTTFTSERNAYPMYVNDLNAMHEAEKLLIEGSSLLESEYTAIICELSGISDRPTEECYHKSIRAVCFAPAKIKAEALLKTLGHWKGQKFSPRKDTDAYTPDYRKKQKERDFIKNQTHKNI